MFAPTLFSLYILLCSSPSKHESLAPSTGSIGFDLTILPIAFSKRKQNERFPNLGSYKMLACEYILYSKLTHVSKHNFYVILAAL